MLASQVLQRMQHGRLRNIGVPPRQITKDCLREFDEAFWKWLAQGARQDDAASLAQLKFCASSLGEALRLNIALSNALLTYNIPDTIVNIPLSAEDAIDEDGEVDDIKIVRLKSRTMFSR
jgi:hypothetical protein